MSAESAPGTPPARTPPWRRAAPIAALVGLTLVAFQAGLTGGFVLDDDPVLRESGCADDPVESLKGLFLAGGGPCAYRPLRHLSFALDRALFGDNPVGYHVVNLLLHALAVVAVFFLARRLVGARTPAGDGRSRDFTAWLAAALFAVHPVQVESVTYISGRRDLLAALLVLASVLAWLRYRATGRRLWAALLPPLFYLALQAKEMAITLPAILVLVDALCTVREVPRAAGPAGLRARLVSASSALWTPVRRHPFLFGALAAVAIAFLAWRGVAAPVTFHPGFWGGSRLANTATALATLPKYVQLLGFPATLMVDYSPEAWPVQTTLLAPLPLLGMAVVAALGAVALFAARRHPPVALGAAWFGLAMLPVMHVIPHHELMAEHHLYIPSIGVFLAVAAVAGRLHRARPAIALALAALLVVPLGLRTAARTLDWRDNRSLWESELAATDDCARAHFEYGTLLFHDSTAGRGDLAAAEHHLRRAVEIQVATRAGVSRIPIGRALAYLGSIALTRGDVDGGLKLLRAAWTRELRRVPDVDSIPVLEQYSLALLDLGGTGADERGRSLLREALPVLDRWVTVAPGDIPVLRMRARTRDVLCDERHARTDYAAIIASGEPSAGLEAWVLTVESFVGQGDLAGARKAAAAAAAAGADSPRLRALREALESGEPPPPPRCPPTW